MMVERVSWAYIADRAKVQRRRGLRGICRHRISSTWLTLPGACGTSVSLLDEPRADANSDG